MKALKIYAAAVLAAFALFLPVAAHAQEAAEMPLGDFFRALLAMWPLLETAGKVVLGALFLLMLLPWGVRALQPLFPAGWTWDDWLLEKWGPIGKILLALWNFATLQFGGKK